MVGLCAVVAGPVAAASAASLLADLDGISTVAVCALGAVVAASICCIVAITALRRSVIEPLTMQVVEDRLAAADAADRIATLVDGLALRDRFDRSVATVDSEAALLRLAVRAASELLPDHEVALLLSLPEEPRVAWSIRIVGTELIPAVPMPGRPGCAALVTGRTVSVASTTELGACAHLDPTSIGSDVSAVCVPLGLGDRTLGVVAVTGAPGELPDAESIAVLEHLVATTGDRLARLRRRKGPSTPGPVDPVTGLPTAPAFRARVAELVRSHQAFCVALIQIDGAEELRQDSGVSGWEDALRLVADTTVGTLRPDDLVCRVDAERISAVLATCTTAQGASALERVRECMVLALTVTGVAHFTCSIGLVDGSRADSVDELLRLADAAGAAALLQGGNRVVIADPSIT